MSEILEKAKKLNAQVLAEQQNVEASNTPETNSVGFTDEQVAQLSQECYAQTSGMGAPIPSSNNYDETSVDSFVNDIVIARSQGGMYNYNPDVKKSQTLILNQYQKSYYKTETLLSKIMFSKSYDSPQTFVQLFQQEYAVNFSEGYSVGQDIAASEIQEQSVISSINTSEIHSMAKTLDLKNYNNNDNFLRADIKRTIFGIEEEFTRSLQYSALLSPTFRQISTMQGNQQGIQGLPNTIHPVVAKNADGFNVIMLNSASGYSDGLFNIRDHYNNPFNRGLKTRYTTEITTPSDFNTNPQGSMDIDSFTQLLNIARAFTDAEHLELSNTTKGVAGQFSGKPIFVLVRKLYNAIMNQSKFAGSTSSNEYSDNIAMLKELVTIMPMTMISKTDAYNTGDLLGFFIYPKSYFAANINNSNDLVTKYNKNAWKESDAILATYYQAPDPTKIGKGSIALQREWQGFGILPNPFSSIAVLKKA
jgi:hypothetical protein